MIRALNPRFEARTAGRISLGETRAENYNWKRIRIISFVIAALLCGTNYDANESLKGGQRAYCSRFMGVNGRAGGR